MAKLKIDEAVLVKTENQIIHLLENLGINESNYVEPDMQKKILNCLLGKIQIRNTNI